MYETIPLDLVKIVQLPVIENHLPTVRKQIEKMTSEALSLACTEETLVSVKEARASLNKDRKNLDALKKEIEGEVLKPLESFRAAYKENIVEPFASADKELKERIDAIEDAQKLEKANEVKAYFDEYAKSIGIDFVPFERAEINVTKSASLKSLKKQAKAFLDSIMQDLKLIATQEHISEILIEYRKTLKAAESISAVQERYKALAEFEEKQPEIQAAEEKKTEAESKVEKILAGDEPVITRTFKITATFSQMLEITEYLEKKGIAYD